MIGDEETTFKSRPQILVVGLCSYYSASAAVNADDLHKKFGFLHAGIPKGNSLRRGASVEFAEVLKRRGRGETPRRPQRCAVKALL
jgi:hypothetical protein